MRITKNKSHKKVILVAALLILVAGGTFGYFYYTHSHKATVASNQATPTRPVNLDPPTQAQIRAGATQKQSTIDSSAKDDANSNPTPVDDTLTVTQTANNTNNGVQQLRYLISQQLNSGTCTLTLTNGSQTIIKTANVQALASSSTCEGFDIATSAMASGQWTAALTVTNGSQSGSTSSTFEV